MARLIRSITMSEEMNPVSPRLVTSRYIHHLSWMIVLAAAAGAAGFWWTPWFYWAAGLFVALIFWPSPDVRRNALRMTMESLSDDATAMALPAMDM